MSEATTTAPSVLTERRNGVLVITLNRPEARNAIDEALADGLLEAVELLDGDPELGAGVLTGAGRGFSAGMDLKAFTRGGAPRSLFRFLTRGATKPLVAAVEGFALAGGFELALTCDLIVASQGARFGLPEAQVGLLAVGGGLFRLPRHASMAFAAELALTAEPVTAEVADAKGLLARLTAPGEALPVAVELAERIARNAPLSVAATKRLLWSSVGLTDSEAWAAQREVGEAVFASADAQEGARSFAERRPPQWSGR